MNKKLEARCIELYKRHDMPFVASVLGVALLDVGRILRKARVVTEVQPHELSHIVEHIDTVPVRLIADDLGLSASQLDQFLRRHDIQMREKTEGMTLEVCRVKTRWLIDTRLKLPVDDLLPRLITNEHFTDNGLSAVVEFATDSKAKCPLARHFSTCAFLIDQAYPDRFKPWQFRHSKQNRYFTGKNGRKNFLSALMWLAETKLGIGLKALPIALNSRSFLSTRTLQDFGLGPHWWRQHWSEKTAMLEDLARHAGIAPAGASALTTVRARAKLHGTGINPRRCAVPDCSIVGASNIEIHHIVQKATRVTGRFDLHAAENLVPLCRHHHGVAGRLRPSVSCLRTPTMLRPWLIEQLRSP